MDMRGEISDAASATQASLRPAPATSGSRKLTVRVPYGRRADTDGTLKSGLADRIERARQMFVSRTRTKIERATELTSSLNSENPSAVDAALEELRTIAHSLSGTAGSFGYGKLSEIADDLENTILSGQRPSPAIVDLVIRMAFEFLNQVGARRTELAR